MTNGSQSGTAFITEVVEIFNIHFGKNWHDYVYQKIRIHNRETIFYLLEVYFYAN